MKPEHTLSIKQAESLNPLIKKKNWDEQFSLLESFSQ